MKFNFKIMVKNLVMFMVWVGILIIGMLIFNFNLFGVIGILVMFNGLVMVILLFMVLFVNFVEVVVEGRGKV